MRLVDTRAYEAVRGFPQHYGNIEACGRQQRQQRAWVGFLVGEPMSRARNGPQTRVVQHEHHGGEPCWVEPALALQNLGKLFERNVLVRECRKRRRANSAHHLLRARVAAEVRAKNDRVGERTDEPLSAWTIAV